MVGEGGVCGMLNIKSHNLPIQLLGQSGCRLNCLGTIIYVDPYLSNSVQELDAPDLQRLHPVFLRAEDVKDANWVLITHDHMDHCDPHTLPKIALSSKHAMFVGPAPVLDKLLRWGIPGSRLQLVEESWVSISENLQIHAVPAAHPAIVRDKQGNLSCVGYILEIQGKRLYIAGDTGVTQEILDILEHMRPISAAILPVNEHNFFRGRRGIIGNMSIREAFQLSDEIGINTMIPVHWDMFADNSVSLDEIRAVYKATKPEFDLEIEPSFVTL